VGWFGHCLRFDLAQAEKMGTSLNNNKRDRLIAKLSRLWKDEQNHKLISKTIQALNIRYDLIRKATKEPGVEEIITQMVGRLANSFGRLSHVQGKRILDIACGSNTSKAPPSLHIDTPFGDMTIGRSGKGYTAQFEPWFCRILFELGADPVGVDFGDLEQEVFVHYRVDLGKIGTLDFLPDHSFDAVQDSRLFGSPEFTAQFPNQADRLKIAQEIKRQEQRLLTANGIVIHSDADALLR
jgi:hypothetical protein